MKKRVHDETIVNPGLALIREEPSDGLRWPIQAGFAMILLFVGISLTRTPQEPAADQASLSSRSENRTEELYSPETLARINSHMQLTERRAELNALRTDLENFELSGPATPDPSNRNPNRGSATNPFRTEDAASRVYNDLHPSAGRYDDPILPQDRINALVEQDRWMEKFDEAERQAYIEAFKANARAEGYEVDLNDRLQVVRVRRLPSADGRYPQSSSSR